MSYPNIPDVGPDIDLDRDDIVNLLLASIALEELGLAHITNAEAEKIQYILGTLEGGLATPQVPTLADLLETNRSVEQILRSVIKNQMLLEFKLEDILTLIPRINIFSNTATVEGFYDGVPYTDSDIAYYNTGADQ